MLIVSRSPGERCVTRAGLRAGRGRCSVWCNSRRLRHAATVAEAFAAQGWARPDRCITATCTAVRQVSRLVFQRSQSWVSCMARALGAL
eukprot:9610104-Alexandrium_andersonii.AAC.1